MTIKQTASMALALAVSATAANAADITWTRTSNGNWSDATNWDPEQVPGAGDNVFFDGPAIGMNGHRDIALGADRTVNSINVLGPSASGHAFRFTGNHRLTVLSGNIHMNGNTANSNHALQINPTVTLQIGDGVEPVTDAVWTSFNTDNRGLDVTGPIHAIAGTQIKLTGVADAGAPIVTLRGDNSNFLGTFVVDSPGTFNLRVEGATNTLGAGTIVANTVTYITDQGGLLAASQAASIVANADVYIHSGSSSSDSIRTYSGKISGDGALKINQAPGLSTAWQGTVQFTGNNTHSGNVELRFGTLQVDGVWTGGGNVAVNASTSDNRPVGLAGSGDWGLGSGNSIVLNGTSVNTATLAPGTLGTIGTLTVGTDESNSLVFGANSSLNIDIDGASADQLIIKGDLNLSGSTDSLVFNILNAPASPLTLVTYTGELTGEFNNVYYDSVLISDPTAPGSIGGQYHLVYGDHAITLVPEPAALSLLGLGALGLLRRRRN